MTTKPPQSQPPLPHPSSIKMIITDVDGTLLDSSHTLPSTSPTCTTLLKIRAEHPTLPIIISTGKQRTSTAALRKQLDLSNFPCCHLNGNVIYSPTGAILAESALDLGVARRLWNTISAMGKGDSGLGMFVYGYDKVYQVLGGEEQGWADTLRGYGEDVHVVPDGGKWLEEKVWTGELKAIKMGICQTPIGLAATRAVLEREFNVVSAIEKSKTGQTGDFAIVQALDFCAEFIPAGQNKGTALEKVCKMMGIDKAGVVAFGDGENDVSMFKTAGMSVAMGNAMPRAREAAVWETWSNDEGGVGIWLLGVFFGLPN